MRISEFAAENGVTLEEMQRALAERNDIFVVLADLRRALVKVRKDQAGRSPGPPPPVADAAGAAARVPTAGVVRATAGAGPASLPVKAPVTNAHVARVAAVPIVVAPAEAAQAVRGPAILDAFSGPAQHSDSRVMETNRASDRTSFTPAHRPEGPEPLGDPLHTASASRIDPSAFSTAFQATALKWDEWQVSRDATAGLELEAHFNEFWNAADAFFQQVKIAREDAANLRKELRDAGFAESSEVEVARLLKAGAWLEARAALVALTNARRVRLPVWLLGGATDNVKFVAMLADAPELREELGRVVDAFAMMSPEDQEALRRESVAGLGDVEQRFDQARVAIRLRSLDSVAPFRDRISPELWSTLEAKVADSSPATVKFVEEIAARAGELASISPHIHVDLSRELWSIIDTADATDVLALLRSVDPADAEYLKGFANVRTVRRVLAAQQTATTSAGTMRVDHTISVRREGQASIQSATLVWGCLPDQRSLGNVHIPLVLRCEERAGQRISVEVHPDSGLRFSRTTVNPPTVMLSRDDVEIVVTATMEEEQASRPIDLRFIIRTPDGPLETNRLRWNPPLLRMPTIPVAFPASVPLEQVRKQPLGVEHYLEEVTRLLDEGQRGFIIQAPRRFGKSTLLDVVRGEYPEEKGVFVTNALYGGTEGAETGFTALELRKRMWRGVAERIGLRFFGASINAELDGTGFPTAGAFDAIRRKARDLGLGAIFIIVDEAQALFREASAADLGSRLKYLVEQWGRSDEKMVPIFLGLCGQMSLQRLMGTDATGAFHVVTKTFDLRVDEDALLLALREPLQTSKAARKRICELASNLHVLKVLFEHLEQRINREKRTWIIAADVNATIDEAVEKFDGVHSEFWDHMRDLLNESDRVERWHPSSGYVVALAQAALNTKGAALGRKARVPEIARKIEAWLQSTPVAVIERRVDDELNQLADTVLTTRGTFRWPLLERLLARRAELISESGFETLEENAAINLGIHLIAIDIPAAGHGKGGQAHIHLRPSSDGRGNEAIRVIELGGAEEERNRARFVREISALGKITAVQEPGNPAYASLPRIREYGLNRDKKTQGIVVYDFIEGDSLHGALGQVQAEGIIQIGCKLARVLDLLARNSICHGDIKPANVILRLSEEQEKQLLYVPVLIDFGNAHDLTRAIETKFGGTEDYLPPEVKMHGASAWSSAGDVYCLGLTLRNCLAGRSPELEALLEAMRGEMASRPKPLELLAEFSRLEQSLAGQKTITDLIAERGRMPSFLAEVELHINGLLTSSRHGLAKYDDSCRMMSVVLEQALNAHMRRNPQQWAKLERARRDEAWSTATRYLGTIATYFPEVATLDTNVAQTIGALRNDVSHGTRKSNIPKHFSRDLAAFSDKLDNIMGTKILGQTAKMAFARFPSSQPNLPARATNYG
ncbi:MAG: hypothetical protein Q8O67_31905 [Deltaproteobacteria bacterium]|nr:hypothetical protein [Deltaproteobacteria bacterium]